MRLDRVTRQDPTPGSFSLPSWNVTSDVSNMRTKFGIASTSNGYKIDTLSGGKLSPIVLRHTGTYRLNNSSEGLLYVVNWEQEFNERELTLYRGYENYKDSANFTDVYTLQVVLTYFKATSPIQKNNSSYNLTCTLEFTAIDNSGWQGVV